MRPVRTFVITTSVIVVICLTFAVTVPGWAGVIAGIGALCVFLAGLTFFGRVMTPLERRSSSFEAILRPARRVDRRPPDLEHLERVLGWRVYAGADFDHHVRPVLRELIHIRVRERFGIDVATDPQGAAGVAGEDLAAIARPTSVSSRSAVTYRTSDIEQVVDRIEAL